MENLRAYLSFYLTRALERLLPPQALYWVLKSMILMRAARHGRLRNLAPEIILPPFFKQAGVIRSTSMDMLRIYLNDRLSYFPERLSSPKWRNHCRVLGLEHVQQARRDKRPIVLAFSHFGHFYILGSWLRANGLPVATVVRGETMKKRLLLNQLKRRKSPFNMPTAFRQNELPATIKFLRSGNPLLVAIDFPVGKQLEVPFRDGWNFEMATGALRLAIRNQAELIPCSIVEEGRWHFCIEFGRPVPRENLTDEDDLIAAGKFLINEMFLQFEKHPEQCRDKLLKRFRQTSTAT